MEGNMRQYSYPGAFARITGNAGHSSLHGIAAFYPVPSGGVLIETEVYGLPCEDIPPHSQFYAMHIHETGDCSLPFDKTGAHYNPRGLPHPKHAGDLPPLLGNRGFAYSVVYTDRFELPEIIGRSLIIHSASDDFTTQPSGNAGDKIGCGVITENQEKPGWFPT
ncbi:MAG: superoxide dismutase family protein [Lachnospiraceae bacterium]|nr:superoxide dismutase family protein [Lachnospiraceae bacterium]